MAAEPDSFYWYDLETSGKDPAADRIMQFAGQRTNAKLEAIDEPFVTYVRLAPDVLPDPKSCLVTGITPQLASGGMEEWQAFVRIGAELSQPGTCIAGYNNLHFDDNFLRHGFYRNLMDPYAHEWRYGNSRFDLINVMRATAALRPDGLSWPVTDEGEPHFRLSDVSEANGFDHGQAHDALADTRAAIFLAQQVRRTQPKLWRFAVGSRSKDAAAGLLLPLGAQLAVHVSPFYSNMRHNIAPVVSVGRHPTINKRVIVADLSRDVSVLVERDADGIREALFASGQERVPLTEVVLSRCPFVAPLAVVREQDMDRLGLDVALVEERRRELADVPDLAAKVSNAYQTEWEDATRDAELALYDGFIDDSDQQAMKQLQRKLVDGAPWPPFSPGDPRVRVLALRLKARIRPCELDGAEAAEWREHVNRCMSEGFGNRPSLSRYLALIAELRETATTKECQVLLDQLESYRSV